MGRRLPRGPDREYALIATVAVVIAAVALIALLRGPGRSPSHSAASTSSAIGAASPVIGAKPIPAASAVPLSPGQIAAAQRVARRFLASYLPVLYGRRAVSTLVDADAHVRSELQAAGRTPAAPRNRTPRVTHLSARTQADGSVVVVALIADRVQPPYQIVCQLIHSGLGWQVGQLANY